MLSPLHARTNKAIANPARAIAFQHPFQFIRSDLGGIAAASQRLPAQGFCEFRACGPLLDSLHHFAQRSNFAFRVKIGMIPRVVIDLQLFGHAAVPHANHITGRQMQQRRVIALA